MHGREERVAQADQQLLGEDPRLAPLGDRVGDRDHDAGGVAVDERRHDLLDRLGTVGDPAGSDHHVEGRQGVARRTPALPHHVVDRGVVEGEPSVVANPPDVVGELGRREEGELEMLRPRTNRGQHLLRIGGGQHEAHVLRRLLERLQQSVGRRRRQHVHLVEDVHLVAARRPDDRTADQLPHGVDAVVRGGVELEQVVAVSVLDAEAALALATRLALDEVRTVERFREDPRRGRLAGATGTAEQVGVTLGALGHGIAQRLHHVVLPPHVGETAGPVAAVERLVGHRGPA